MPYNPANPRHGHSCNAVGGSQIISIGGVDSNSNDTDSSVNAVQASTFTTSPDQFAQGIAIFDMTKLQWVDHYTANAPAYEQSSQIKQFYASASSNGYGSFFHSPRISPSIMIFRALSDQSNSQCISAKVEP